MEALDWYPIDWRKFILVMDHRYYLYALEFNIGELCRKITVSTL